MISKKKDTATTVAFRYTPGDGCCYRWEGGPYIDVHRLLSSPDGSLREEEAPFVTINVWDYAADAPRITRSAESLMREVDAWRIFNPQD